MIGGARLTNEDAYAWAKLAKGVLGTDSVDAQLGDGLPGRAGRSACPGPPSTRPPRPTPSCVLSGDLREELPVLFLRLRAAVVDGDLSWSSCRPRPPRSPPTPRPRSATAPGEAAAAGRGPWWPTARAGVRPTASTPTRWPRPVGWPAPGNVVVIVGRPSLAEDGALVAEAAQALAAALPGARFLPALRRGNVHGALDMGLAPGLLPGRVALEDGRDWFDARLGLGARRPGAATPPASSAPRPATRPTAAVPSLVVLGADPLADFPDRALAAAGPGRRRLRGGRGLVARAPSTDAGRRGAAGGRGPRAAGHHHQHRGPDQPAGPEAGRRPARPGPTG